MASVFLAMLHLVVAERTGTLRKKGIFTMTLTVNVIGSVIGDGF